MRIVPLNESVHILKLQTDQTHQLFDDDDNQNDGQQVTTHGDAVKTMVQTPCGGKIMDSKYGSQHMNQCENALQYQTDRYNVNLEIQIDGFTQQKIRQQGLVKKLVQTFLLSILIQKLPIKLTKMMRYVRPITTHLMKSRCNTKDVWNRAVHSKVHMVLVPHKFLKVFS